MRFQRRSIITTSHSIQESPLRRSVWRGQARARTILLHTGAHNCRASRATSPVAASHMKCATALAAAVPVRATVERVAPAKERRHACDRSAVVRRFAQNLCTQASGSITLPRRSALVHTCSAARADEHAVSIV